MDVVPASCEEFLVYALVGFVIYALVNFLLSLRRHAAPSQTSNCFADDTPKASSAPNEPNQLAHMKEKAPISISNKPKKKSVVWRTNKTSFNHQYLATSVMGHTSNIMGIDCSADAKFLVTCADDEHTTEADGSSSCGSSDAGKENRSPSESPAESTPGSPAGSRRSTKRRRKPRTVNRDTRNTDSSSPSPSASPQSTEKLGPLHRFTEMKMSEQDLAGFLSRYLLNYHQLSSLGYPIEANQDPDNVVIYATDFPTPLRKFDVNAKEFIPGRVNNQPKEYDSGRGSGSSTPQSGSSSPRTTDSDPEEEFKIKVERKCARCNRGFFLTPEGDYITRERCHYHWGRLKREGMNSYSEWGCCGNKSDHPGCSKAPLHVWSGTSAGVNGPLKGYVRTKPRAPGAPRRFILALDCEMCYTGTGLQIAQVEVIGADGRRIYNTYVRPDSPVIDYNTRFSGISPRHLQKANKTLKDVQNDLLKLIDNETILVGHALENDLRAIKLLHNKVVDTAVSFAHPRGLPFRMSLRNLAATFLNAEIHQAHHSPLEDARVSLDLMLLRVQRDFSLNSR